MTITVDNPAFSQSADLPGGEEAAEFYSRYEPREVLGRGLVSVVRKCIHRATGDVFAVKIIDVGSEEGQKILDETKKEIEILKELRGHENVIKLQESFETPSFIFLVLEFCTQGELFDHMTTVVTVSSKRTRQIMHKLLSVIDHMHEKFIVHRDIKPENILLDENLNIKVSDFGFATFIEHDEELTELMGTPAYLSPEVLKCSMSMGGIEGYGRPTDVWACGVVMYTLLSGQPPFWHRKQMMMLRMIMEARYSLDKPEWDDVSPAAKDLIRRLLEVNPEKRITARQALNHDFFVTFNPSEVQQDLQGQPFNARLKLRAVFLFVHSIVRLKLQVQQKPVTPELLCTAPYNSRTVRKMIDSCAFGIYGHWVKKGDQQNRAALFENHIKSVTQRNFTFAS
ncbi:phosphorylase b kinase gamma catalytic chain, skeletal muscle/heart isoform-like isoform X2 [Convolutriloba macropyga]|uniref:phosphorylase b kinase gamma catalytic chain, skeletal muscle/heart isoform-like isoform X2 n=1 Tax=Convolutriloba macropyga TaxID=536237 RepID=UPI003F51FF30